MKHFELTHTCVIFGGNPNPNYMLIADYTDLIRSLPFLQQAFTTREDTWEPFIGLNPSFHAFYTTHFKEPTLKLSRADVFANARQVLKMDCLQRYYGAIPEICEVVNLIPY